MTDHPYATELLLELMDVAGDDALLPLQVLMNLHRPQLQAPAVSLGARLDGYVARWPIAGDLLPQLLKRLNQEWPTLAGGEIFRTDTQLVDMLRLTAVSVPERLDEQIPRLGLGLTRVLGAAMSDWHPYEPLQLLHQFTWRDAPYEALLQQLEHELSLDSAVERIVLHYKRQTTWPGAQ